MLDLEAVVNGAGAEEALLFDRTVHDGSVQGGPPRGRASSPPPATATLVVRLWDIETDALLLEMQDRPGRRSRPSESPWIDFSPDGSYLLYADGAGILRKYFLDTDHLVELAEDRLTRGFTAEECASRI